jgi:hypothetical protein
MALATGLLGIIDLAGASVRGSAYIAVPLAVVAAALILGAWYGRARWLIAVGIVLSLALGIVAAAERADVRGGSVTWRPTTVELMDHTYTISTGSAVLDLSALDFTGRSEAVDARVGVGDLVVIVGSRVDVRVEATVNIGNGDVFGTEWDGIGQSTRTFADNGTDGPGGGDLVVRASVDVGNVEVRR